MSTPATLVVNLRSQTIGDIVHGICISGQDTTIVVTCCKKAYFFNQLQAYLSPPNNEASNVHPQSPNSDALDMSDAEDVKNLDDTDYISRSKQLLEPTLSLLSTSLKTKLVFCPSIPTLRACLPTLAMRLQPDNRKPHKLVIIDMLALHHGTSEFTIQGLSRSFALLASVCHNLSIDTELVECTDSHDALNPHRGSRLWMTDVPLLSGSVKIGEAGQGWANRTTSIKTFAERWFNFH